MLKIGQEVPDFKFDVYHNNEFKQMKLSDTRGKWTVLLFYPADFTFVCPTELEEAAHYYEEFKSKHEANLRERFFKSKLGYFWLKNNNIR